MAHRLHQPLRGLRSSLKPPPIHPTQKRAFTLPRPPPPPPALGAARRAPTSLPLSALRSLAQHIVSSSKRYFSSQPAGSIKHKHLPQDLSSRMRTMRGQMPGMGFHSSASGARFGPGGLGRGPMGPGVKGAFSRGVGNVGLGSARGYASMSRPLLDGLVGNTPLTLRALANGLDDQADNLKKRRHRSLHHSKPTSSASSARAASHPYLKPAKKIAATAATVVEETSSSAHALFFTPTEAQTLPAPLSPSTTTTLFLPFSLASTTFFPDTGDTETLSGLASSHRAAYVAHATRVEALIRAMEDRGVFLDPGVREEEVMDWGGQEILGVKVVFHGRNEEEVRKVLGQKQEDAGEGEWWFLHSEEDAAATSGADDASPAVPSTLVYPTIPLLVTPSEIFTSASNSLFEGNVLEERAEWSDASSRSLSSDDDEQSTPNTPLSSDSASLVSEFEEDEDIDDGDWMSEVGSSGGSLAASSSSVGGMGASFLLLAEERDAEEGTDLFSSAYWSEMGGSGMEMR